MNKYICKIIYAFPNAGEPTVMIQEGESVADIVFYFLTVGATNYRKTIDSGWNGETVNIFIDPCRDSAKIEDYDALVEIEPAKD